MALALSSCLKETGYSYTTSFTRIVTIDATSTSVRFVADYTNEVFDSLENLKYPEQLARFGLENAQRAEVYMKLDVEPYKQTLTMLQGKEIDILPVAKEMPTDVKPFLAWQQTPLATDYNPTVWVSGKYLNVVPVIPAEIPGKYYLTAEKAVNDTLYFNLEATYRENASKQYYDEIQCYDLSTLCDTTDADATLRMKMTEIWKAMEEHRADSMRIVLTGKFAINNYYGKDTIMTISTITNYFKPRAIIK